MSKKLRQLLSLGVLCICLTTVAFGDTKVATTGEEIDYYAQVYEGNVRINALRFNNSEMKEPLLIYKGNYYLPMTSKIMDNLGLTSGMSSEGNIEFLTGVPKINGEIETLSGDANHAERLEVIPYKKDMYIDELVISQGNSFTPVIVYNNTIYLPLNYETVTEGLELDVHFSDNQELTIIKDMEKSLGGTLVRIPQHSRKEFIESTEAYLVALKEKVMTSGTKYELDGQTQYVLEREDGEDLYVLFDDGSWMVAALSLENSGVVMHVTADAKDQYIGEYVDGVYQGIGRYRDEVGNFTAIKEFNDFYEESIYTEETVEYLDYTPALAVLVEFSDERLFGSDETWHEKLFSEDANSLRGYYKEITHNQVKLIPAIESNRTVNDGIVRVALDIKHPDAGGDIADTDEMIRLIAEELEGQINMQLYDQNDNGVIDQNELAFITIVAGYEASNETPSDYAQFRAHHRFSDISMAVVDDIGLLNMIFIGEREYFSGSTDLSTMGVFAHELGHQFGLPDLYDTDDSSKGLGPFSLMAEGTGNYVRGERPGETIAFFDPWSLIQLKAVTPEIVKSSGEYVLKSAETGEYNVLRINTSNPSEYFLLENRTAKGRDLGLKNSINQSGGILIYHIDENIINANYATNTINDDENHKGIDIEEASERSTGAVLDDKDFSHRISAFFTAKGVSKFNNTSTPRSRLNDGSESGLEIEVLTDGPSSMLMITIE